MINSAVERERNWIRNFSDYVIRKSWKNKGNYFLKGALAGIFAYSLIRANENKDLLKFRKEGKLSKCDLFKIYYNTGVAFSLAFAGFVLI